MRTYLLFLLVLCLTIISCEKESDTIKIPYETRKTNEFVYSEMKYAYLWSDKIPDLNINSFSDPTDLFNKILYKKIDKWSIITDDFPALVNRFKGISTSFGSVIHIAPFSNSQKLFGVVMYVYDDSPAYNSGLRRGDLVLKIDDQEITENNYRELFGKETYTLTLGTINNGVISENGKKLNMTRREINENPILHHSIISKNGTKVGYLMYDSFIHRFDEELKSVFANFKQGGVTELILDLRYNPGGEDVSAQLLGNLIAPSSAVGKYFFKSVYNANLTDFYAKNKDIAVLHHADGLKFEHVSQGLDLKRVFILTSKISASSSELVINGLRAVMNVYMIGQTTHGKCTGMRGIPDDLENPKWGMFPVIVKASNNEGITDYYSGFEPNEKVSESLPLAPFGDETDPLISAAIRQILGESVMAPTLKTGKTEFEKISVIGGKPEIFENILMN